MRKEAERAEKLNRVKKNSLNDSLIRIQAIEVDGNGRGSRKYSKHRRDETVLFDNALTVEL